MIEFEIKETIDLHCEDDDGNPVAQIRLGRVKDDISTAEFLARFNEMLARIPPEFLDKAQVTIGYGGVALVYERPLTQEESAKVAAENAEFAAEGKEERRQQYEELRMEFDPDYDPSGKAHEPISEAA